MAIMFWTVKEVAAATKVNAMTIRRAIQRGELEAVRVGKAIRITPESFRKFLRPVVPGRSGE